MALAKKFKLIAVCALALSLAASAILLWFHFRPAGSDRVTLYGNVEIRQVDLGFRVGGRIAEVLVDEGDEVEKGTVLARLDSDLLAQELDQASAQVSAQEADLARLKRGYRSQEIAQARAAVAAARAVADNATINLRRVTAMRAENAISQRELDNARAQDREAAAKLRSAQDNYNMFASGYREEEIKAQAASLDSARAQLQLARIRLDDVELRAPQKGVILTRAREEGAIVQEGQTVYTLTLTDPVWLRAYVSEPQLGLIKPGMPVRVSVDATPGKTFPGIVGFISPVAEFTPKTVETPEVRTHLVYRIRIHAEDPENVMRQGMPVTIFIDAK